MSELEDWQAWRRERDAGLRHPHGWLAITAIHWLGETAERFDDAPGAWTGGAGRACVDLADDETLTIDGRTLGPGRHDLGALDAAGVTVAWGDAVAQVADRDGRTILRPRHPDSPHLRAFRGTPTYPYDPAWLLPARVDGDHVVLRRDQAEHRLRAETEDDGRRWILFRDATSGVTTYAAMRQLLTDPPAADGTLTVDLNRAANMPCAYTDFATCPVPPPGNTLPFAVEAGEQLPVFDRG